MVRYWTSMDKTIETLKGLMVTGPARIKCVETGDVARIGDWADRLSEARGVSRSSVRRRLFAALQGGTYLGFTWVKVSQ
jgi:hypothetical protein